MKAVAAFVLVLCSLAVSQAAWRCKQAPNLYRATQVDASVGIVVATTRSYYAYMLFRNRWVRLGYTRVKHCTVGPTGIWAVGLRNRVYRYLAGSFRRAKGRSMKQVDAGADSHLVGTSTTRRFHCLKRHYALGFRGYGALYWTNLKVPRYMKYVSCGGSRGSCWGVTRHDKIICSRGSNSRHCKFNNFRYVAGHLAQLEVSTGGQVVGVNKKGLVFYRYGISRRYPHGTRWIYIPMCMAIKHVTRDLRRLYAVTTSGLILGCTY